MSFVKRRELFVVPRGRLSISFKGRQTTFYILPFYKKKCPQYGQRQNIGREGFFDKDFHY